MRKTRIVIPVILASGFLGAAEPDAGSGANRPVSSREIEQLRREISDATRSSIEGIFDYHTETGDVNNRLDFFRYGARANYRWRPRSLLYLQGTGTSYLTRGDVLNEKGFNLTAGVRQSISEAAEAQLEIGATRFTTDGSTINALGSLRFKASGGSGLYITGSRTNVEESLLSAAGIRPETGPFAGRLVGQAMDNRGVIGGRLRLLPRVDVFVEGGGGARTGKNVETNLFKVANGGVGYDIVAESDDNPLSLLRASYALDYFGFEKDLLGYGGVSLLNRRGRPVPVSLLGTDGISPAAFPGNPGTGGYFSPDYFVSNVGRLEAQGRPLRNIDYRLAGFLGAQNYTGSPARRAAGFLGSLTIRLSDRYSLPVTYVRDNFGPFTQESLLVRLVARL